MIEPENPQKFRKIPEISSKKTKNSRKNPTKKPKNFGEAPLSAEQKGDNAPDRKFLLCRKGGLPKFSRTGGFG